MASTTKKYTKDGRPFYEIRVHLSRNEPYHKKRWYPPDGWSEKAIQRELKKVSVNFENDCKAGIALTRVQKAQIEEAREAEAAKIETLKQYAERIYIPKLTVHAKDKDPDYSPHTIANYQGNLKKWIYPAFGDVKLPEITGAMVTALLLDMQAQGKAHGTILRVKNILGGIFKMAYMDDSVEKNPMEKVIMPKKSKEATKDGVEAYTAEQVVEIVEALNKEPLFWQVFVRLLLETGIRRGEGCGLKWSNIDFNTGEVIIAGSLNYTKEKGVYYSKPKNGHVRSVFIGQELIDLLKKYKANQKILGEYVFTTENGHPIFPDAPTRYFKRFSCRYGIPNFHPHILRHTFATLAVLSGADIASLSAFLGHEDISTTLRMYTHANKESVKKVGSIVQSVINEQHRKEKMEE